MKKTLLVTIGFLMLILSACGGSAETTPPKSDSAPGVAAPSQVSFANDVMPILEKSCGGCHSSSQASGGFIVSSYDDIMQHGEAIVPGNASGSLLIQLVSSGKMPKRGDKLTAGQIQTITEWIDAGAPNN